MAFLTKLNPRRFQTENRGYYKRTELQKALDTRLANTSLSRHSSRMLLFFFHSQLPANFVLELFPPGAMLVELNGHGHVVRALMDVTGDKVRYPSEVAADADSLYVGSFRQPFIVRIRLDRLRSVSD